MREARSVTEATQALPALRRPVRGLACHRSSLLLELSAAGEARLRTQLSGEASGGYPLRGDWLSPVGDDAMQDGILSSTRPP